MFVTQGPVPPESGLFVDREAELKKMQDWLSYVSCVGAILGARQTGKTSLLLKLRHIIRDKFSCAFIDLQGIEGASVEECFSYVAEEILGQLADSISDTSNLSVPKDSRNILAFLREFSKRSQAVRIIVILDEFGALPNGTAIKLAHTIRAVFTNRLIKPEYARYIFLVAGATDMLQLTTGKNSPLKNVTESIYMCDLPLSKTGQLLAEGFGDGRIRFSPDINHQIHGWTSGHPYWTQLLAATLAGQSQTPAPELIGNIVEELLQTEDKNLPHVLRGLQRNEALLPIVKSIFKGNSVPFSRSNLDVAELELIGIIKNQKGVCAIRNKIYQEAIYRQLLDKAYPSRIDLEAKDMKTISNAYALIIGVGNYLHKRYPNLPATIRDARVTAETLIDPHRCGYVSSNVQVITDNQVSAENIKISLQDIAKTTNEESTVVIYFSGHGGRIYEDGEWRSYICPREADPDDLSHTAIPGIEFSNLIAAIPARKLVVILDACHAGGSINLKDAEDLPRWKAGLTDIYYESLLRGSGRVVIASSKEEQFSHVKGELSLFTYYLREALNGKAAVRGNGLIHVLDVFHYVNEAVQKENPQQVPILKIKDLDLNFPIALDLSGSKNAISMAAQTPIPNIRESIVQDPASGAEKLSLYLATQPEFKSKQIEVDLKRNELKQTQRELDLIGPNENDKATKNRIIYFLLRICSELEEAK